RIWRWTWHWFCIWSNCRYCVGTFIIFLIYKYLEYPLLIEKNKRLGQKRKSVRLTTVNLTLFYAVVAAAVLSALHSKNATLANAY
ncbi:hypothetical protein, partial [Bacillus sp. SIMBA_005]|uniref:hypothetical protein n=1 Tax=Bacillus sp. SIMBA_005 TaxID=3085754 RepID=UPI00397A4F48